MALNLVAALGMVKRDRNGCWLLLTCVFATKLLQAGVMAALPRRTYIAHRAPIVAAFRVLFVASSALGLPTCCTDYDKFGDL